MSVQDHIDRLVTKMGGPTKVRRALAALRSIPENGGHGAYLGRIAGHEDGARTMIAWAMLGMVCALLSHAATLDYHDAKDDDA